MTSTSLVHKLLIIDDDHALLRALQRFLTLYDYEVITESDPRQALTRLNNSSFSLALFDLQMPELDGKELSKSIAAAHPSLPLLLMTADIYDTRLREIQPYLAHAPLEKPFSIHTLLDTIDQLLHTQTRLSTSLL